MKHAYHITQVRKFLKEHLFLITYALILTSFALYLGFNLNQSLKAEEEQNEALISQVQEINLKIEEHALKKDSYIHELESELKDLALKAETMQASFQDTQLYVDELEALVLNLAEIKSLND